MKLNILKIIFSFGFFFSFVNLNNAIAESNTYCNLLIEEIKNSQVEQRLDQKPMTYYWGVESGIIFEQIKDLDTGEWIFTRDDNGYLNIFTTKYKSDDGNIFDAYSIFNHKDKVIALNDIAINNLNDAEIKKIINPDLDIDSDDQISEDLNIKVKYIAFLNSKIDEVLIKPLYTTDNFVTPEIVINNFKNIDSKRGHFEMNYLFSYYWQSPELALIAEKLMKDLILKEDLYEINYCEISTDKFSDLQLWNPSLNFTNILSESSDESSDIYLFEYYPPTENEESNFYITYQWIGTSLLYSKFDFTAFPFDSQILTLELANTRDEVTIDDQSLFSMFVASDFSAISKVPDWDMVSKEVVPTHFYDDYWSDSRAKYILQLRVERNNFYYIYKIIVPIMIILIIAWSSLWISPNELQARLTVTIVCLLSLIAYNYTYDKDLPKLDYATLMDYFILLAYLFAAVPSLIAIYAHNIYQVSGNLASPIDTKARYLGPIIFMVLVFVISLLLISDNSNTSVFLRNIQGLD